MSTTLVNTHSITPSRREMNEIFVLVIKTHELTILRYPEHLNVNRQRHSGRRVEYSTLRILTESHLFPSTGGLHPVKASVPLILGEEPALSAASARKGRLSPRLPSPLLPPKSILSHSPNFRQQSPPRRWQPTVSHPAWGDRRSHGCTAALDRPHRGRADSQLLD